MRVLFVSYFLEPNNIVGAKRVSYWHKQIFKESDGIIKSDSVYADIKEDYKGLYAGVSYHVPNSGNGWMKHIFTKDLGSTWYFDLKKKLIDIPFNTYDFIVFSGSPFLHMLLIKQIKKRTKAKVIVDFRDPFAVIPRFKQSTFKLVIKKWIETRILKLADHMITVNKYCEEVIIRGRQGLIDTTIINNGFDEQLLEPTLTKNTMVKSSEDIVLCGKLDSSRNPDNLFLALKRIEKTKPNIFYYGNSPINHRGLKLNQKGTLHYKEFLNALGDHSLGIIITSGHGYESTTKVFDYLAAGLEILIISDGLLRSGDLHSITKEFEGVYWVENKIESIQLFIEQYKPRTIKRDLFSISRKSGLQQLIRLLSTL